MDMPWWHAKDTNPDKKKNRGEIWIYSDHWFRSRAFSWSTLGLEAVIRQSDPPPPSAYRKKLVYREKEYGSSAGQYNTLEYRYELITSRPEDVS